MRILKGILLLILAAALTIGCFWIVDNYPYIFRVSNTLNHSTVEVASGLTGRIYSLETGLPTETFESYETGLNKEVSDYLKAHSGGSSSGGGGSYYYDDDDDWYDSGGGGGYYDDGGSSGGGGNSGGGWTEVDVYVDDTEYNICHICGYEYIGTGSCPNPACPGNN